MKETKKKQNASKGVSTGKTGKRGGEKKSFKRWLFNGVAISVIVGIIYLFL